MRGTVTILRRELVALFLSPLAWVLLFVTLLLDGYLLASFLNGTGDITGSLEAVFGGTFFFWALILILPSLLAMRLLAQEAATGTLEYLRTAPVTDAAVVLGKFLAGLSFMAILWSSIFFYAAAIASWGAPPDWGQVMAIWIGAVLASGVFVALSLMVSAYSQEPLLAAFLSFMACLGWLLLPLIGAQLVNQMRVLLAQILGDAEAAGGFVTQMVDRMSVFHHFGRSYYRGVVDSAELCFFLTWIAFFLFLTTRTLEARRWRG